MHTLVQNIYNHNADVYENYSQLFGNST